mgnify:CR=1 FL=1
MEPPISSLITRPVLFFTSTVRCSLLGILASGIYFSGAGSWLQNGDAVFSISSGTNYAGIAFEAPGATWIQNGDLTAIALGANINGKSCRYKIVTSNDKNSDGP